MVALPETGTGERSERRRAHRRLAREQLLAALVILAALALTVAVLLSKWMGGDAPGLTGQSFAGSHAAHLGAGRA
jgi:hypothetical protein